LGKNPANRRGKDEHAASKWIYNQLKQWDCKDEGPRGAVISEKVSGLRIEARREP